MTALGVLGFDDGLVSRAVHPHRTWIDGWNLNPARHDLRGVGDLDGNGRTEAVITSDWGIGILGHEGGAFRCPFGAPRDTLFGEWRYDATSRTGRDRLIAIEPFTHPTRPQLLVWSSTGMTTLERTRTGLAPTRLHTNGTRLGGWVLSTVDNRYCGSGRFTGDDHQSMVLMSPWGLGLISLAASTHLFMAPTGSRLGDWVLHSDSTRVRLVADLDGDGQDELLVSGRTGIGVLKMVDGRLTSIALHPHGSSLAGYVVEAHADFAVAARFRARAADDILVMDRRGLHLLALEGNRLVRRAFTANGVRVDGWRVDSLNNTLQAAGNVTGGPAVEFVLRSPWGIGVMGVDTDNRFRCHGLHPYGATLGSWPLESSDIIAGTGAFTTTARSELLVMKPWAGSAVDPPFTNTPFKNWHGNIQRTVRTVRPKTLAELVSAVRIIHSRGETAGVAGSGWSFTDCAVGSRTQALIDTTELNATLGGLVPDLVDDRAEAADHRFVHVEAGIKLYDLNCRLERLGLALPTLGGSRGQSLAGVLSTGVHGADVSLPPIADAVRAIHLVGPGGQQWWIEPTVRPLTTQDLLNRAKARGVLDPSIKNVYDTQWFNALLVAMGCAGVIYSVVIECRPRFRLRSTTTAETWARAQQRIKDLAFPDRRPRSLEINVNPADQSCRVTVRNETTEPERMPAAAGAPSLGALMAGLGLLGPGALGLFFGAIGDYIARTTAEIGLLSAVPFAGPVLAAKKTVEALRPVEDAHRLLAELNLAAVDPHNPRRVAEIIPTAINLLWAIGMFVVQGRTLVDQLQGALTSQQRPEGTLVGKSFQVMTGQPTCAQDGAQHHEETERLVESFEYAVSVAEAIAFVDRLLAVITELRRGPDALIVNLNLRFTARTRATLGMQQFAQTCHVEIYTFRGMRGNEAFKARLRELVQEFRAVPHWGQFHAVEDARVVHGTRALGSWRATIHSISAGNQMFWSDFALTRRLL